MVLDLWRPSGIGRLRPSDQLEAMEREMEHLLEHPFRSIWRRAPLEKMFWAPAIDYYEKDDAYFVRAELSGVKLEDVDISVTDSTLTIKGERKEVSGVTDEEYQRCEIAYGSFSRSITLPNMIRSDKIEATLDNGILEVRLPKVPEAKPTKIEVKAKKVNK